MTLWVTYAALERGHRARPFLRKWRRVAIRCFGSLSRTYWFMWYSNPWRGPLAFAQTQPRRGGATSRKSDRKANDRNCRYRSWATYPLALSRLRCGRAWRDDGGDSEPRSLVPQFRPCHLRCAVDRHRPVHGLRDRADPAQGRPVRAP